MPTDLVRRAWQWLRTVDVEAALFFAASACVLWLWSTWPS